MSENIMKYLNDEQKRFYDLIVAYPRIAQFWDWKDRTVKLPALNKALPAMSHGEQLLATFFVSIWLGKNEKGFDMVEAASVLDAKERIMIANWLAAPFWP